MNDRVRLSEQVARPDARPPAPGYYYPAGFYPPQPPYGGPPFAPAPQHPGHYPQAPHQPAPPPGYAPPPFPQQSGGPGYAPPSYSQPSYGAPAAPAFAQPQPSAVASVDDAVAQIAARQRSLEAQPSQLGGTPPPFAPSYAPQPAYSPQPAYPPHSFAPPLAPDLSGLEGQLRLLTSQIESLREPQPDFAAALRELREDLAEIGQRLTEALPRRAIDALEAEVRHLAERIDRSRAAGIDPQLIAGMEQSLNDVRDALRSLKPAESLAGFEAAIRNLAERIESGAAYHDPASLQQLESAIAALRGIVANIASNDALAGLAEEVRGLSARIERVGSGSHALDAESLHALEQRIASLPVLTAIERGFFELNARLDALQMTAQPGSDPAPAVEFLQRDLGRTQDSLEAMHSTLGHLVDRLATIEGGIREARMAAEMPAGFMRGMTAAPAATAPAGPMPPLVPTAAPTAPVHTAPPRTERPPVPIAANPPSEPAVAPQAKRPPAPLDRQPIDPNLPPDYPLEPGSGAPRARPAGSASDRIAASEAALGPGKPGGANHPGQTNFIAAARRAAQAAAAEAPQNPAPAAESEKPATPVTQRMRALVVGASVIVLVIAGARIAMQYLESEPAVSDLAEPAHIESAERPVAPVAPMPAEEKPAPVQTPGPATFNTAPAGVIGPERPKPLALVQPDREPTGAIGKRAAATPERSETRLPAPPPLPEKLPAALRQAAAKGQPTAEYEIGIRLLEGKSVPQNNQEALLWLERAAKSGLAPAHFRIGGLYEKGIGVKKNLNLAREHYLAAAEKGSAKAMHNLAVLYAEGIDGKPDYKTAARWFQSAAEHGIADSQYNLGILYARGIGIGQNLPESYKWFALAALQGDRDAAKKRDDVGGKLDSASLAAANAAVQAFTPLAQPEEAVSVMAPPGGWDRPAAETAPSKKPRAGSRAKVTAS